MSVIKSLNVFEDRSLSSVWSNTAFRRLLYGRTVTNVGDSLYLIGAVWLVHELSSSTLFTGLAGFLFMAPQAFQFVFGPLVDDRSIVGILSASQLVQGVVILLVPIAHFTGTLSLALLLVIIPLLSTINQVVYPAQEAALPRIVSDDNIVRANSLFSISYRSVDIVSQAIGGIVIATIGAVLTFVIDSVTFLLAFLIFRTLEIPDAADETMDEDGSEVDEYVSKIRDGFRYVKESLLVFTVLAATITNFALGASHAVLPKFADLQGGPATYGFLLTGLSVGMVLGSVLASVVEEYPFGKTAMVIYTLSAILWTGFVYSPWVWSTVLLYALAWVPVGIFNIHSRTVRQLGVPDEHLGKVSAACNSAAISMMPVGSLVGGALANVVGVRTVLAVSSLGFLSVVFAFLLHPDLRRLPSPNEVTPKMIMPAFAEEDS